MPVNQLQLPGRREKRSAMDTILQGLQIANEVFKIPAAYQDLRSKTAQADYNKVKAAGGMTQADLAEKGMSEIPASDLERKPMMVPYAPDYEGPRQLLPSAYYGPKPKMVPVQQADGSMQLTPVVADQAKKEFTNDEAALAKEYSGHQTTKTTNEVMMAAKRALEILDSPRAKFGPDDISLITLFQKMNDPGSAVRGEEFENARKAQGLFESFKAYFNKIKSGEELTPAGRERMRNTIQDLVNAQLDYQGKIDNQFMKRAEDQGFRKESIVPIDFAAQKLSSEKGFGGEENNPEGLTPKPQKSKSASNQKAGGKPMFVIQDGHRYMWNEKTKKYE